jgi:Family of unknown function (DUF6869)
MQKLELDPRDPNDRDLLISEWLRYAESGKADGSWAYDALAVLIDKDPALAWAIILELVHRASPGDAFDLVAAGPLEDLVAWHGREVIDLIEIGVGDDEPLRRALSGLWIGPDTLDPKTLERLRNVGVERIE